MSTEELVLGLAAVIVPTIAVIVTAIVGAIVERRGRTDTNARIRRAQRRVNTVGKRAMQRIDAVDERAVRQAEAHQQTLESMARDLSFLAGRQAERDAQTSARAVAQLNTEIGDTAH